MEFQYPQLGFGTLRLPTKNGELNITKIEKMVAEKRHFVTMMYILITLLEKQRRPSEKL